MAPDKLERAYAHFGGRATKACPDWAERVLEAARVCRFCGYRFAPDHSEGSEAATVVQTALRLPPR